MGTFTPTQRTVNKAPSSVVANTTGGKWPVGISVVREQGSEVQRQLSMGLESLLRTWLPSNATIKSSQKLSGIDQGETITMMTIEQQRA